MWAHIFIFRRIYAQFCYLLGLCNKRGIFFYIQLLHSEWGLIHFQDPSPLSSQQSPSTSSPASWNQAIDPRLFSNGIVTTPFLAQTTSTTSELANALTLPTPRPKVPPDTLQQPADQPANGLGESSKPSDKQLEPSKYQEEGNGSGGSTRFCSVKGCKAVIPGQSSFFFIKVNP